MFSLQRFFGKEDTFLTLFESAISEAEECAKALQKFISEPERTDLLEQVHIIRQRNKQCCEKIAELVVSTFVTALEREDIEALRDALYKIPKPLVKFAERLKMARPFVPDVNFSGQVEIVVRATAVTKEMIHELRKGNNLEYVRALNLRMQQIEMEADNLENSLLHELFEQRTNSLRIIIIKDLYELLEKGVDRCRDLANLITHIVLKNS